MKKAVESLYPDSVSLECRCSPYAMDQNLPQFEKETWKFSSLKQAGAAYGANKSVQNPLAIGTKRKVEDANLHHRPGAAVRYPKTEPDQDVSLLRQVMEKLEILQLDVQVMKNNDVKVLDQLQVIYKLTPVLNLCV